LHNIILYINIVFCTKHILISVSCPKAYHRPYHRLAETNNVGLIYVLTSLVSELQKPSSLALEPWRDFRGCAFVPVISSPKKKTNLAWPRSSIVHIFRATEKKIFIGTRTKDSFFGIVAFAPEISSPKKTTLASAPFFYRA
jgi:hypothetical protein